ncbi:MAG: DUF547 domain-containing protein [Okeania sp. SIO2G4]|uniref:DUF547 domain-containing protein n=1 Tax=unclassified Okeania TaxID=2634635 RepID=UPI0013BC8F1B|nr:MULTISPECIES: DUF547 domain-containing protein [unclassified Okeania]NEP38786.1 DUF547 domain-containing protein [Okeania sp. SIO2H7]NEP70350.1 DUF547 domain-containing protein [Okeania sp. SIO2G5]NEP91583.1 DUF547 domain-containing protein [Okeania sp. SIO2F5]NEQ89614.1 DUF547 domain-containing protein [Okeania sp. SIO2G4]
MRYQIKKLLFFLPLLIFLASCGVFNSPTNLGENNQGTQESTTTSAQPFNYQDYNSILKEYVNAEGLVDYERLKENRQKLDEFNAAIGAVTPSTYGSWTDAEKIAFLVNAYNSFTLESIIDNYPTKSIRRIPGVWKIRKFDVAGEKMTLDHIEHQVLRKEFNEPGIHVALVCAAISCPPLRREAFTGNQLEQQLDDQANTFLINNQGFLIDRENNAVYFSSIFKWFGEDYKKTYGQEPTIDGLNETETAIVNYAHKYVNPDDKKYLKQGGYQVKYSDYDWSLNVQ